MFSKKNPSFNAMLRSQTQVFYDLIRIFLFQSLGPYKMSSSSQHLHLQRVCSGSRSAITQGPQPECKIYLKQRLIEKGHCLYLNFDVFFLLVNETLFHTEFVIPTLIYHNHKQCAVQTLLKMFSLLWAKNMTRRLCNSAELEVIHSFVWFWIIILGLNIVPRLMCWNSSATLQVKNLPFSRITHTRPKMMK